MSLEWAVIGIPGFAFIAYLLHRARAIGARNRRRADRTRQWLNNHERGQQ